MTNPNIETIYPLSPLQKGLLFHSLYNPQADVYVHQWNYQLKGDLNPVLFQEAWQQTVNRHAIFRTLFTLKGRDNALQVVVRQVRLPFEYQDWSDLAEPERTTRLSDFVEKDRITKLDIRQAPLMRLNLIRLDAENYHFVLTFHHLILDGWSMNLMFNEIKTVYNALAQGQPLDLAPVRPYSEYIGWLEQQDTALAQEYWTKKLSGFSSPTPLSFAKTGQNPKLAEGRRNLQEITLSAATTTALKTLARRQRLTVNTIIQGAWALLLSRYSGESDVVFGTTVAGRPADLSGVENMVGVFINSLPLRVQLNPSQMALDLLLILQKQQLELRQYEYSSLAQVQKWSEIPRGESLFNSLLVFTNAPTEAFLMNGSSGWVVTDLEINEGTNYPLTVGATPGDKIVLHANYAESLFETAIIQKLLEHWQVLIENIVDNPYRLISEVELMTAAERQAILHDWNATATPYAQHKTLHQLFDEQAVRTPDAVALEFGGAQLTYAELNAQANQLSHYLIERGIRAESRVGVCLERSFERIVALLAVLKAGGAYLPLDPTYPQERLAYMVNDSQVALVISQASLQERLPAQASCLLLDETNLKMYSTTNPSGRVKPDNLAYLIYTSGSTGQPKGVMLAHQGAINLVEAQIKVFKMDAADRVLQFASFSFDASVSEIFTTLAVGACLCLPRQTDLVAGEPFVELLRREAISVVTVPPTLLATLPVAALPALKTLVSAGEAGNGEVLAAWATNRNVVNAYGPTEGTVCATTCEYAGEKAAPPIGRPLQNMQVYLLDEALQPVPVGVPGELYIGGAGLARGYLGRPELTAQRFIPNPHSREAGARLYKTGDLARYRADGNIEFIGRVDTQVKLRGYRIELGEIEAVLNQHPAIQQSAVVVQETSPAEKRLVAYLVPAEGQTQPDLEDVRRHLRSNLPEYMQPGWLLTLPELPLTANGKLNKAALPAPQAQMQAAAANYQAPRTPAEQTLANIWAQVLALPKVSIEDNFFELGGDSILSIQIIARANQAGLRFTAKQLFELPTIAKLATLFADIANPGAIGEQVVTNATPEIATAEVQLSPIQQWFFERDWSNPHHFNVSTLFELGQTPDLDRLAVSLSKLIERHDSLRLGFNQTDNGEWQAQYQTFTGEQIRSLISQLDLAGLAPAEQQAALQLEAARLHSSFDLANGPLLRLSYLNYGPTLPGKILIVAHHLVMDSVSWSILVEDLNQLYQGQADLPALTTSWQSWTRQLNAYAKTAVAESDLAYWQAQLNSRNLIQLPTDFATPLATANRLEMAHNQTYRLDRSTSQALLTQLPGALQLRTHELLMTALANCLAKWSNQPATDLLLDLEGHGRSDLFQNVALHRTLGWFTTLYPVRFRLGQAYELPEALNQARSSLRQLPKQGLTYGVLRYLARPEVRTKIASLPAAQVSFNYLGQAESALRGTESSLLKTWLSQDAEKLAPSLGQSGNGQRSHLLEINAQMVNGQLEIDWEYSRGLYRDETISRLSESYAAELRELLKAAQSRPKYTPANFPDATLSQAGLDKLMSKFAKR